jgi:uncharacterized protein
MTAGDGQRVVHEPAQRRFTITLGTGRAVLEYRPIGADSLDYYRTFVPPELRGRGLASEVTEFALRYALERNLKVVPTCPFVAQFIKSHPELEPVLGD